MRRAARLALVILALAACGKKSGGSAEGSGGSAPGVSAGPAAPRHGADEELRTMPIPELAAGSRAENIPDGPLVVIGEKSIIVEGRAMVVVDGGKVDPAALQTTAGGARIVPIANWADSWSKTPAATVSEAVLVAIDPKLPSSLATQVIASLVPSKLRSFAFVVRTPDGPGTVPLVVPDAPPVPPPAAPAANPDDQPIGMVVTLTTGKVLVWSTSALEGTMTQPRLELTPPSDAAWLTGLRDMLTDIARRRWDGRTRPAFQSEIIVMLDRDVASADLVNVIAAVRKDAKGNPLFPDVRLASAEESAAMVAAAKPPEPPPPAPADDKDTRERADVAALEEEASRYAAALLLSADDPGISSGDLDKRAPGSDLSAQLADVREGGAQVAIGGGGSMRGTRGDGDPRVGAARGPMVEDGALATPSGRIMISAHRGGEDTSLASDVVIRKIQSAYMAGLKRCYKQALKMDPTVRGTASIGFTVNEMGRALHPTVNAPTPEIGSCLEGLVVNWTFPRPKDVDGEATDTDFQLKLALTPD